jgi:hypothetical protein
MLHCLSKNCRPFGFDVVDDCALACMAATTTSGNAIISPSLKILAVTNFEKDQNIYDFHFFFFKKKCF